MVEINILGSALLGGICIITTVYAARWYWRTLERIYQNVKLFKRMEGSGVVGKFPTPEDINTFLDSVTSSKKKKNKDEKEDDSAYADMYQ